MIISVLVAVIYSTMLQITEGGSCGPTTNKMATENPQTLVSSDVTKELDGPYQCSWIIKSTNSSQVIWFNMANILVSPDSTCQRDYVVIRAGDSENGRLLRVWCKDSPFNENIYTKSDVIYVQLVTFSYERIGLIFILSFWTSAMSQSVVGPVHLGLVNYLLIAVSIIVLSVLLVIFVYLYLREVKRSRQMKKETFKQKLRVRRQGISGMSGGIENLGFQVHPEESSIDTETSFSYLTPSPDFSV